jgi:hypothetical protein
MMSEQETLPAGDYNVAREIEGLKELIKSGDTSSLTILRLAVLIEGLVDRVGRIEQQLHTLFTDPAELERSRTQPL